MRKQWLFPIGKQKYKIEKQSQNQIDKYTKGQNKPAIYFIVSHILNKLLSLKGTKFEKMLSIVLCETIIKFSYMPVFSKIFALSTPDIPPYLWDQ